MEADERKNQEPLEVLVIRVRADGCSAAGMSELYSRVALFIRMLVRIFQVVADLDDLQHEAFLSLYSAVR